MSKCDIRIALDREGRTYAAGETVTGTVFVRASAQVRCKELAVEVYWETRGKGDTDREIVSSVAEREQDWSAGAECSYPFSFVLPVEPFTYHGHDINVDYHVGARADLPWAIDSKAREEINVVPRFGRTPEDRVRSDHGTGAPTERLGGPTDLTRRMNPATLGVAGVALLLVLYLAPPLGLVLAVGALYVFRNQIRSQIAERRLGDVTVETSSTSVSPGEAVPVRVSFPQTHRIEVNAVTATLKGEEICSSGSGDRRTTYRHALYEESITLSQAFYNAFESEIRIPDTDAYTFRSRNNEIAWRLAVRVDVPRWPDWHGSWPVVLRPKQEDG